MSAPIPRLWIPLTIDSSNAKLRFRLDSAATDYTATIASATYDSPEDLLAALNTAMLAADAPDARTYLTEISATTGKVTITPSTGTIKVTSVAADCNELLGFAAAGAADFAASNTSDYQAQNYWSPDVAPTVDDFDGVEITGGFQKSLDGHHLHVEHGSVETRPVSFQFLEIWKVLQDYEDTHVNESIERLWPSMKTKFRWWADRTSLATYTDYFLEAPVKKWRPLRMRPQPAIYAIDLLFGTYQA